DFTASAHPLVFRPLVERLRAQGNEVEITARDYAQTLQLIESHGMTATVIGHHGGRSSLGKATQMRARLKALRDWARDRGYDLAPAGDPELDHVRLRVGLAAAPARLPRSDARRRPPVDPAGTPRPLRDHAAEAPAVPGPEGGVLPLGLRAGRVGSLRLGHRR